MTPEFPGTVYNEFWRIWIDFNEDGDFTDAGEEVFADSGTTAVSGNISIPANLSVTTRMRVSMKWNAVPESCETFSYGEVEDYTISIVANEDCTPGESCDDGDDCTTGDSYDANCNCAGVFQDSDEDGICDNEDDTLGDCMLGESCDDGDACTTGDVFDADCNCAGTLQDSDEDGICDAEDECPNDPTNTCEGDVTPETYCDAAGESSNFEYIKRVRIGNMSNTSNNDGGYGDYTNKIINATAGSSISVRLIPGFLGTIYDESWKIWIDFNQDGDFTDANEEVFADVGSGTILGAMSIPSDVSNGATRMRISMKWNEAPEPCETFSYGEVEDYTIVITGGNPEDRALVQSDLIATRAPGQQTELRWYVNQPATNKVVQYTVQHSSPKVNSFIDLKTFPASDNVGVTYYEDIHVKPDPGMNGYQVKMEFEDGRVAYTPYRAVNFEYYTAPVILSPNPAQHYLNVDLKNHMDIPADYVISSLQGRVLVKGQFGSDHAKVERLDVSALHNGIYIISILPEGHPRFTEQLVIMKDY